MGLLLSLTAPSSACEGVYTTDLLFEDLTAITDGMRDEGGGEMTQAGTRMEGGILCMAEPMTPSLYAATYRALGVYSFNSGDPDKASLWFRVARELEPTYQFDIESMDLGSALYKTYDAAKAYEGLPGDPVDGMRLVVPSGSKLVIDGRLLDEPKATTGRYHVVQQVGSDGAVRASWLVVGNEFPANLVEDATLTLNEQKDVDAAAKEDNKKKKRGDPEVLAGGYTTDEVVTVTRERPPMKTPLLVASVAGLAAAGGVYGASYTARQGFDDASTVAELDAARTLTNTLVLAGAGVAVVGLGVGGVGILLADEGPGLTWSMRF
ncbi:MAG TPA: hypothetical protein QGF58_17830 [Myxococcota bacterium]|nr:hypothetical protein [Myxococcota bacterium]